MEKVIVYGLGNCWNDHWHEIAKEFDIICCIDKDAKKESNTKGFMFNSPRHITDFEYDKLIICAYGVGIGIREEIILLWDIPVEKIYYFSELHGNCSIRTDEEMKKQCDELTIVIPTYNRKNRLKRTLDILERQTCKNFKVIILDNASNYNIDEIIEKREKEFRKKVEVRRNINNIGMQGNLAMIFLQVYDGWIWTLADDDIPSVYAVETIIREIEKNRNIGVLWFSINNIEEYINEDRKCITDLAGLTEFYRNIKEIEKDSFEGDFIYLSNKIYNANCVMKYLEKIFTYSYTGIPQIMPILFMLSEKDAKVVISNKKIVIYDVPEKNHWNWIEIALGMSTIVDIPLNYLNNEDKKNIYRLIMLNPDNLLNTMMKAATDEVVNALERLYNNIYKLYLDEEESRRYLESLSSIKQLLVNKKGLVLTV